MSQYLPIFSIFKGFDTEHKSNYQKKMIISGIIVAVNKKHELNRAWKKAQKNKCIYKSIRYRDYNNSFNANTASINYILGVFKI